MRTERRVTDGRQGQRQRPSQASERRASIGSFQRQPLFGGGLATFISAAALVLGITIAAPLLMGCATPTTLHEQEDAK